MKRLIPFAIIFFSLNGYACDCEITNYTNAEKYSKYDFILSGSVVKIENLKSSHSKVITLRVFKRYKGIGTQQTVRIGTSENEISCGLSASIGDSWLIYGFKKDSNYTVSVCSDSKLLNNAGSRNDEEKLKSEIDYLDSKQQYTN